MCLIKYLQAILFLDWPYGSSLCKCEWVHRHSRGSCEKIQCKSRYHGNRKYIYLNFKTPFQDLLCFVDSSFYNKRVLHLSLSRKHSQMSPV